MKMGKQIYSVTSQEKDYNVQDSDGKKHTKPSGALICSISPPVGRLYSKYVTLGVTDLCKYGVCMLCMFASIKYFLKI